MSACPATARIGSSGIIDRYAACRPEWGQHLVSCPLHGTAPDSAELLARWRADKLAAARS